MPRLRGVYGVVALTMCLSVAVSGCSAGAGHGAGSTASTISPPTASTSTPGAAGLVPSLAPPPPITWAPCKGGLQCGYVTVPLDYQVPAGPQIEIALARHLAGDPGQRIGSLLINPGGPGGSGIDDLPEELKVLTPGLLARFDIVSFDPRGVDRSAPVGCGEAAGPQVVGAIPDPAPPTAAGQAAVLHDDEQYAAQCASASGLLLAFVGTVDTARDMDRIRAALGDATVSFIGHSYGTLLGLTYAQMFPTRLRAMVLDGVIDPALSATEMALDQAEGFEASLQAFFSWCQARPSCPWHPGADPTGTLLGMIAGSRAAPIAAGAGNSAGPGELYTALLAGLYSPSSYPELAGALAQAAAGNGRGVLAMTNTYDTENGPNAVDANTAINCLDHPVSRVTSAYPALAAQAGLQAPVFGPMLQWSLLQCALWPALPSRVVGPLKAEGAPPILVVGTSGDPATPQKWAASVARELTHGVLVTWDGQSHVAYYYSGCVRSIDQAYLLNATLPAQGTVCRD